MTARGTAAIANPHATDHAQALWLAVYLDRRFVRDIDSGLWHVYHPDTGLWPVDSLDVLHEVIPLIVKEWSSKADTPGGEQFKARQALLNNDPVRRALEALGTMSDYKVTAETWDKQPHLLGCANGVVDLKTGLLLPASAARESYVTMSTGIEYHEGLTPTGFLDHMALVQPDESMRAYLLRTFGYMLTGETGEQLWWFWYGPKAFNGKSQTADIVRLTMGEYGVTVPPALFIRDKFKKAIDIGSSIHALRAARMGDMAELSHVAELDSELLKRMVEGTASGITYRPPYGGRDLTAHPPVKLIGHGNSRPEVTDSNNGFWRRVKVIPWDEVVPEGRRIRDFGMHLVEDEGEAILSLLVREARAYYAEGLLPEPGVVKDSTDEYRASADHFALWFNDEVLVTGLDKDRWPSSDVYAAYDSWCMDNGVRNAQRMDGKTFKARLEVSDPRITAKKTAAANVYTGMLLPGRAYPQKDGA